MDLPTNLVERLNQINWLQHETITPEAESHIEEHLKRIRTVLPFLVQTRGLTPAEAYAVVQSGGHASPGYQSLLHKLFRDVTFRGVGGVREALILSIASGMCWEFDSDLGKFPNPWEPLLWLYNLGYTSSFEEGAEGATVDLVIGLRGGERLYPML